MELKKHTEANQEVPVVSTSQEVSKLIDMNENVIAESTKSVKTVSNHSTELLILSESQNVAIFKGFTFWTKFISVVLYIFGGLYIILGIPALILFGLGLIYMALGGLFIFLGTRLWGAAELVKNLDTVSDTQSYISNTTQALGKLRTVFKTYGIIVIVGITLLILGFVLLGSLFSGLSRDLNTNNTMMRPTNSTSVDNNY